MPHNIVNYREDDFIKTTDDVTSEDEERKQSHKGIKTKVGKYFIAETYGVEVNAFGGTFKHASFKFKVNNFKLVRHKIIVDLKYDLRFLT